MSANEAPKTADDVYKGKKVLKQDQPQRTQAERYDRKKAVDEYNKKEKERYERELKQYEKEKAEYEKDLAEYNKQQADYEKKVAEYNKKLAKFNQDFKNNYGISYDQWKQRSDELTKLKEKYQTKQQEIEAAKQKRLTEYQNWYWTKGRYEGIGRSQYKINLSRIAEDFDREKSKINFEATEKIQRAEFGVAYPSVVLGGTWYRDWQKNVQLKGSGVGTLIGEYEDELRRRGAQAQRARESSIKQAQSDAIIAANKYAKDVGIYSGSIQNFSEKITPEPFKMKNPTPEFKERVEKIKPISPVPVAPHEQSEFQRNAVKSKNRPTYTGVKFETITVDKPQKITQKGYEQIDAINNFLDQYKSTAPLSEGLLTGIVEEKTGQKPYIATKLIIQDLTQQSKPQKITRQSIITDPKTGETFNTKTGIGSFKIGAALGYQYNQNLQRPVAVSTTESGEIEIPTMYSSTGQPITKKQTVGDRGLDLALGKVDELQAIRPDTPLGKVGEFFYGQTLGVTKETLATVATLKNFYEQKIKTLNFRGEAEPLPKKRAPTLKEVGKYISQKIQFGKSKTDEITVPPTLFSTVTDPIFKRGVMGGYEIPQATLDYTKKYGVFSTVGEGTIILAGTGIEGGAKKVGKFIAKKAEPLTTKTKNIFTKPIDSKLQSQFVKGLESQKIKTSISGELVKTTYKFEEPKPIPVRKQKISTGAPTPVNWSVEKRADLITSRADAIPPTPKNEFNQPLRVGKPPQLQKIGTYKEPVIKVPKGIDKPYVESTGKPPVSIDWTPEDVVRTLPSTGKPPVQPKSFDVSLPDKAGKIPKVVPNTPVINPKAAPLAIDYSPESLNMFKPRTGKAPLRAQPLQGFETRPLPPTGRAPTLEKIGTYKEPIIKVPKGIDKPYVESTGKPPVTLSTDWNRYTKSSTRLDELPVFKEVTPPTPRTGAAPRLDVIKRKTQPTYEYSQLNVIPRSGRVKNVESLQGITPKELQPKQTPKFTVREALPKGLESYSILKTRKPITSDYTRWNVPRKPPRTGAAPINVFRYSSTDFTRKIPKVRGQPEIKPIDTTPKAKPVDYDPLFVKTKGRIEIPKGVEPLKYFKSTELNIGTGKTNADILDYFKSPVKPTKYVSKPKVFKQTQSKPEPQKPKTDYPEIKSKSGTVTIMKKPTQIKKQKTKTFLKTKEPEIKPTRTITNAVQESRPIPKTGRQPLLFVPYSKQSKKKRTTLDTRKQSYSKTNIVYDTEVIKTPPKSKSFETYTKSITSINVKPKEKTNYISKSFSIQSQKPRQVSKPQEKSITKPIQVSKPIQSTKPKQITKTVQKPKAVQKPKQKQRLTQRTPIRTPTKARTVTITRQPQRSRIGRGFGNDPTGRKRKLPIYDDDKKPQKTTKDKSKKGKQFLGNVSEYSIIGTYDRSDIIRNKKKIQKETKKDTKLFKKKGYKVKIL